MSKPEHRLAGVHRGLRYPSDMSDSDRAFNPAGPARPRDLNLWRPPSYKNEKTLSPDHPGSSRGFTS
jgi:hypothetical protein